MHRLQTAPPIVTCSIVNKSPSVLVPGKSTLKAGYFGRGDDEPDLVQPYRNATFDLLPDKKGEVAGGVAFTYLVAGTGGHLAFVSLLGPLRPQGVTEATSTGQGFSFGSDKSRKTGIVTSGDPLEAFRAATASPQTLELWREGSVDPWLDVTRRPLTLASRGSECRLDIDFVE